MGCTLAGDVFLVLLGVLRVCLHPMGTNLLQQPLPVGGVGYGGWSTLSSKLRGCYVLTKPDGVMLVALWRWHRPVCSKHVLRDRP